MSGTNDPASVSGAGDVSGSDTVSIGTMHLTGGLRADLLGQPGMQFVDGGGLNVDFVDLSAAPSHPFEPAASGGGPISFADWHAGDAGAAGGASVPAAGQNPAWEQAASGGMLAEFSVGLGAGLPGGAMQPRSAAGSRGAHPADLPERPIRMPFRFGA